MEALTDSVHAVEVFDLAYREVEEGEVISHLDRRLGPRAAHARPEPACLSARPDEDKAHGGERSVVSWFEGTTQQ